MTAIPVSIANVPIFYNLLPVALLHGVNLIFDELDKSAFKSIKGIAGLFKEMFPSLIISLNVKVNNVIDNRVYSLRTGTLFSIGLDSWATLIDHIEESPETFTIEGADIKLNDTVGWERVTNEIKKIGKSLKLKINFIASNFKEIMNIRLNDNLTKNFERWHDAHHSQGLLRLVGSVSI